MVSGGWRVSSFQFEDDLNRFRLPGFGVFQVAAQQKIARALSATLAMENLTNREFVVGFSPTPLIGNPRLWRIGLRWH
jgi:outer membrane receptor protein involved in Fe transport